MAGTGAKDGGPDGQGLAVGPFDGGRVGRVDVDDREVAVTIGSGHGPAQASTVGERHGDLVATQIVGVGKDLAPGDDDPGSAGAAADPDDGGPNALGDGGDGGLEFFDDTHGWVCSDGSLGLACSADL